MEPDGTVMELKRMSHCPGPVRRGETYRLIKSAILSDEFPAGKGLPSERVLMKRYGVTRTTIRRALAKLIASGYLNCQPRIGYRLSPVIQGGKPVKTHAIGMIWRSTSEFSSSHGLLAAMEKPLADRGHVVMLAASGYEAKRENAAIRQLTAGGMDCLIVAPARTGSRSLELERWIEDGRPVVLHGHPGRWLLPDALALRCHCVDSDNNDGIRQIVKLLADLRHQTVGFLCMEDINGSERFEAFKRWAGEFGLLTEPRWWVSDAGVSNEGAGAALAQLRGSGKMPTAIICSHDAVALPFMDALRANGLCCPRDISVVGFEGQSLYGENAKKDLTTVDIRENVYAQETMRLMTKPFTGDKKQAEHVRVPVSLIVKGSVAPPWNLSQGGSDQRIDALPSR